MTAETASGIPTTATPSSRVNPADHLMIFGLRLPLFRQICIYLAVAAALVLPAVAEVEM